MARAVSPRRKLIVTLAAWGVALVIFFPVLWMILTSFKTEPSAVAMPPQFLSADWTLENYAEVWARTGRWRTTPTSGPGRNIRGSSGTRS